MKKITSKKSIDLESEFIGKPVGPRRSKEKKPDATDEIKSFLENEVTRDSIKKILLRMQGPHSEHIYNKAEMFVFELSKGYYIFKIHDKKRSYPAVIYLGPFVFTYLEGFGSERLDRSFLRQKLAHAIRDWLHKNPDQLQILP